MFSVCALINNHTHKIPTELVHDGGIAGTQIDYL